MRRGLDCHAAILRLGVVSILVTGQATYAAIGLLAVPEIATDCRTNKVIELPGPALNGAGVCSNDEYRRCVATCVDNLLPWRILQSVNCSYVHYNRSYAVAVCECNEASEFPPLQPRGPRAPIDVGKGLWGSARCAASRSITGPASARGRSVSGARRKR